MNQTLQNQTSMKFKVPVLILSIVGLVMLTLSFLLYVAYSVSFDLTYTGYISFASSDCAAYFLRFLEPIPCIFLLLYAISSGRSRALGLIAFLLAALSTFGWFVWDMMDYLEYGLGLENLLVNLLALAFAVFLILAGIFICINSPTKAVFSIVAAALGILLYMIYLYYFFGNLIWYLDDGEFLIIAFRISNYLGCMILYVAMLFAGLDPVAATATAPAATPATPATPAFVTPEQELEQLNEAYGRGALSAEEYWARRNEIIGRF